MGATPGVTNLLAKHGADHLDEAQEIHVSFAAMRPFALSPALTDTILREERRYFIEAYAGLGGKDPDHLMEMVNIREPLISIHWVLWAATMLSNLRDQRTTTELVEAHKEKTVRYERVANPENIERLIERCNLN